MKLELYSIFDSVAKVFNKPYVALNDEDAKRSFTQAVQQVAHKNDYVLYSVGSYTDHDGVIVSVTPNRIYSGFDVKTADVIQLPSHMREQA